MKISIITPSYNSEKYIEQTMLSVLSQRGDFDLEYILVDGASKDNTCDIVNKYVQKHEKGELDIFCNSLEMRFISEPDNGMYDALAKGLSKATGDIVAYINSDDFYLPSAFKTIIAEMKRFGDKAQWVNAKNVWYNKEGIIENTMLPLMPSRKRILKGIHGTSLPSIQQESTFWTKSLQDKMDLKKFAEYKMAGDFFMWHEFAKHANLHICNSTVSGFRTHEDNKSHDLGGYMTEFYDIVGAPKVRKNILDFAYIIMYKFYVNYTSDHVIRRYNEYVRIFRHIGVKLREKRGKKAN
ncbi:glycosyltransferase [Francisella adeliensis]|uniref:Glycosyl transferase n=1 Tax=Francisella adeliensis TaxID=2007306 RepID=A0A2Z4XWZ9_9GAMM|nr:glycosyltransferase [Francisella adeliensis]AXA33404.1 glycosyl transferase [Francisella adeliensis]MBK2085420.1 glycosyltransferase [Francisella adeliensis]MBK2097150.1 glycosyltransferase [Francisella adeliensis]QIW11632.1 glycosyltransferase [Francisella adeliensis]QIW13507.1 glycosyltransferase [Francisella adeliensis]